ncbi:hypothetical protein EXU30_18980 [Shewanella maritima]|uniref:Uncharacterized protein n=1 Tax=Shewanella maritima TaxID=2520507 RepID=A0A411PLV8_9GAMM|nr:hypothetical protein [Shewanella maritima]QBF84516.1 hypothetical protein EXU30_18980 [Shewanella maritima]
MTTRIAALILACAALPVMASEAENAFTKEVLECAAYYDISSQVISSMDAPQMAAVADRLQSSADKAVLIANDYMAPEDVSKGVEAHKEQHMQKMAGASLGVLMKQYKDTCKSLVDNPQQRLDYWTMATM